MAIISWASSRQDKLAEDRDGYVRFVAGLIDAARFIQDPKNADKVADDRRAHRPHQGEVEGGDQAATRHRLLAGRRRRPGPQAKLEAMIATR